MKEAGICILRAINLNKRFGGLTAVDNVSFGIDALGVTSIIGPNGAGKSTLFNLLSGSFLPDSGSVFINDQDVTKLNPEARFTNCKSSLGVKESTIFAQLP